MNTPFVILFYISIGVLLMGAFHAALLARSSAYTLACRVFAAMCFCFALFQFFTVTQYLAEDVDSAVYAHKWANFFSLSVTPLIAFLVASLDRSARSIKIACCVLALTMGAAVYNYVTPYGYRFVHLTSTGAVITSWGEGLHILSGELTEAYRFIRFIVLLVLLYAIVHAIKVGRQVDKVSNRLIWISIVLMVVTSSFAGLSDVGKLSWPYLGGFGFLFLSAAFLVLVKADASNKKLQVLLANRALEQEVNSHQIDNQRFEHVLYSDPLTGLPNRAGTLFKLDKMISENKGRPSSVVVFLFDLDRLGIINGIRGHKGGDQLLQEVTRRLKHHVSERDFIGRFGNAGFAVCLRRELYDPSPVALYEHLALAFTTPFYIGDSELKVSASTGVSMFPEDAVDAEGLLAAAEVAVLDAKYNGMGNLRVFHPCMKENIQLRIDFETALKEALGKKEFFLCYQPQVEASGLQPVCMEALIRWNHPVYGLVMPDKFIPAAESMGIMSSIGAWVIEQACEQLGRWRAMGFVDLRVAINLSAQQLLISNLEDTVRQALARSYLVPQDIELEITESALMQDPDRSIERFSALRKLGVRLSIDDFGTGYSSLAYLKILPVHALKLDRSFVADLTLDSKDLEICTTAISLGKKLGLEIVAEGVETEAQIKQLRILDCHLLQGYYFSRPLTVDAATDYLIDRAFPQKLTAVM
jgi:diguanylate cyclase (GGDEF)-like protein